jgi:hypothetical protein
MRFYAAACKTTDRRQWTVSRYYTLFDYIGPLCEEEEEDERKKEKRKKKQFPPYDIYLSRIYRKSCQKVGPVWRGFSSPTSNGTMAC